MSTLRLCVVSVCLFMLAAAVTPATAQTVAAGPYYATPSWDQTIACATPASCPRFIVLSNMASNAVLDRETGLVWERSPATNQLTFDDADAACSVRVIGGRLGWRLPTRSELRTLMDPSVPPPALALPAGHPFLNVIASQFTTYWTTTPAQAFVGAIHKVSFGFPTATFEANSLQGATGVYWCVRGGPDALEQ
jgi:hypothetical protein